MFDVGFSELVLCFVVALVVLGPQKLPALARTLGRWTGRARVYIRNLQSELERETQVRDLKRQLQETQSALREQTSAVSDAVRKATSLPAQEPSPETKEKGTGQP